MIRAFDLSYAGTGFRDDEPERRLELVERVSAKVGGRWRAVWETENDVVHFTRRPNLPRLVPHPGLSAKRPWHVLPFADGGAFDLMVTSHLLIVGATNSGKTAVLRSLIVAAAEGASVWLADPKRVELIGFRDWPGIARVATADDMLHDFAMDLHGEMEARYRAFEEQGTPLDSWPPIIAVIDEFEEYAARMKAYAAVEKIKRPGEDSPAQSSITSILRLARRAGIHVIIGTQRPDASWFGGAARDNMQGRAAVGRMTQQASTMLFGRSDVARDVPLDAKGRTTVQTLDDEPVEVQAYWVPDPSGMTLSRADRATLDRLRT